LFLKKRTFSSLPTRDSNNRPTALQRRIQKEKDEMRLVHKSIWNQMFKSNSNYCFVKLLSLNKDDIYGLEDYLYDEKRQFERLLDATTASLAALEWSSSSDNQKNINLYFLSDCEISECYIIDKYSYLKHIDSFTTDKEEIYNYLESLVSRAKEFKFHFIVS
jgi:hypothetical protein